MSILVVFKIKVKVLSLIIIVKFFFIVLIVFLDSLIIFGIKRGLFCVIVIFVVFIVIFVFVLFKVILIFV